MSAPSSHSSTYKDEDQSLDWNIDIERAGASEQRDFVAAGNLLFNNFRICFKDIEAKYRLKTGTKGVDAKWRQTTAENLFKFRKLTVLFEKHLSNYRIWFNHDHKTCVCPECLKECETPSEDGKGNIPENVQQYVDNRKKTACTKPATRMLVNIITAFPAGLYKSYQTLDRAFQCQHCHSDEEMQRLLTATEGLLRENKKRLEA
jgi:hypothetical protein